MILNKNVIGTREHIEVIESEEYGGLQIEVLEYQKLMGARSPAGAKNLYFMSKQGVRCRQVALYLDNESVEVQAGAMNYLQGNISMVSGITPGNVVKRVVGGKITGEKAARPVYTGTGMLVLEPSFKHFLVLRLDNEDIIVDKGMFFCAQRGVEVEAVMQRSLSAAVAGGEGLFQIRLHGSGLVVLESDVPLCEIDMMHLNNDMLMVDGNFAILRSSSLGFTTERSAKTLVGSAVSGEGLVNVYRGTGDVWLAPTLRIYDIAGI